MMKVRVLYFAQLRQIAGLEEEFFKLDLGTTVAGLLHQVFKHHPKISEEKRNVAISVNQEIESLEKTLFQGDEVALLPPMAGG